MTNDTSQNDMVDSDARIETGSSSARPTAGLASLAHWSFPISFVVPFANLIIPLVLLLSQGQQDDFVRDNAKEALNLFIWTFIMAIVFVVLIFVVIGIVLLIALGIYCLVMPIVAAISTMGSTEGQAVYRYPLIFRLIK
jgi:uncharacterized Tic20 family protein